MPYAEVNNVGEVGIVSDLPEQEMPPEAWSAGANVRFLDGRAVSFPGDQLVVENVDLDEHWALFGTTSNTAHFWVQVGTGAAGNKVYAYDGTTQTDITPAGGLLGARSNVVVGDLLNQNLVITNAQQVPQTWGLLLGSPMVDLPAWDADWRCGGIRSFKGFLIAFDITESGTRYPYRVRWSDQAQPGGLPASWDALDPTVLAGAQDLGDSTSFLVGGLPLRDTFLLYSERETTGMQLIRGNEVFRFFTVSRQSGLLSPRALATFRAHQMALSEDDVVMSDGQSLRSVIDRKRRRWLFSRLSTDQFNLAFMTVHPTYNEVWLCFPSQGSDYCDLALVWDWQNDTWGVRDLPEGTMDASIVLDIVGRQALTWASNPYTWSNWNLTWGSRSNANALSTLVMGARKQASGAAAAAAINGAPIYRAEGVTSGAPTTTVSARVERRGLRLSEDRVVTIHEVWPRLTGGPVNVLLGSQNEPNGSPVWETSKLFVPGQSKKVTCRVTARYPCIAFESLDPLGMQLSGYRVKFSERALR